MESPSDISVKSTIQQKFESELYEYEQQHLGSQRKPWTAEKVLEVMNNIRQARVTLSSNQKKTSMDYYWLSKYDITTIAGEEHLIFKRKSPNDPTVRIISRDDYFRVLKETHETCNHGGRDKIINAIKTRFYIPKKAIEIYLMLCPKCENKKSITKKSIVTPKSVHQDFDIRGQIDLIDFQSCPDGEFNWLLIYQDIATKFLVLRPLKTKRTNEVAEELMKIFMIFGAPYILHSYNGRDFTANIIEELIAIWPECKIVHGNPTDTKNKGAERIQDIKNMLRRWMCENNSESWSLGCHHVQYEKNASYNSIIGASPYKAMFGSDPKTGLSSSAIPSSILQNMETEEQLKSLSDVHGDIKPDRTNKNEHDAHKSDSIKATKRGADQIIENTAKKLPPLSIGETVIINVPKADRGPLDFKNITAKIVDFQNGVYRVGTKVGTIKNWFTRKDLQISTENYNYDIPDEPITLSDAVPKESLFEEQGFHKCICKPAQNQCHSNRCACFKKKIVCGSKCHNNTSCVNK